MGKSLDVAKHIANTVQKASTDGAELDLEATARSIARSHPADGHSKAEIAEVLEEEGLAAGVPVAKPSDQGV